MKRKGSFNDFAHKRNAEIMGNYRKVLRGREVVSVKDMLRQVADAPYSQFWVSELRAADILSCLFRGKDVLKGMRPSKRAMYEELYRRACRVRERFPTMSIIDVAWKVVHTEAPRLYLDPSAVKVYISRMKKGVRA